MPGEHAKLSPSASERWMQCPASVGMEELVPEEEQEDSSYAREGTNAHTLAELKARLEFKQISEKEYVEARTSWKIENDISDEIEAEMDLHTEEYVKLVKERVATYPNSIVMFEQRLDTGVERCWGTSDTVIVSPTHIEIIDFKYGSGVYVIVTENSQTRLYACGALDTYGDLLGTTEEILMTIHQPRMDNIATEILTPEQLREWRGTEVVPKAEEALGDDPSFGPSPDACRWCAASGRCRAQLEEVFKIEHSDPELLTEEEIAEILPKVALVSSWINAVKQAALNMAYAENKTIPGYKVVMSRGQRSVTDHEKAIKVLLENGYVLPQIANTKAKGIGELEKLLTKPKFKQLLEDSGLVRKGEGNPSIVLESDDRPSISPNTEAAKVFGEEADS